MIDMINLMINRIINNGGLVIARTKSDWLILVIWVAGRLRGSAGNCMGARVLCYTPCLANPC